MFSADELKTLRSKLSDDQILEGVRKHGNVPDLDIDRLKKGGLSSTSIIDGIAKHGATAKEPSGDSIGTAVSAGEGILGGLRKGASDTFTGVGESAKQLLGAGTVSDTLKAGGDIVAPTNYKSGSQEWKEGNYLKGVGKGVVEGLPGLGTDLAAGGLGGLVGGPFGAAAGFLGSNMARSWGTRAKQIAQERSGDANAEPDTEQKFAAAPISLAEAALSRLGLKYGLGTPAKGAGISAVAQIPGQIAKGAAGDAVTSAAGDIIGQSGVKLAAGKNPLDIDGNDVAFSAATGAATGGGIRTARGVSDVNNAIKFRKTAENPEAASRFADRLSKEDLGDATKSFEAMNTVRAGIEADVSTSTKDLQKFFNDRRKESNNDSPEEGSVKKLVSEIRSGKVVSKPIFDEVRQRLADGGKHGEQLVRHLEELNEHNRLGKFASSSEQSGRFAGGLSGFDGVENFLNPVGRVGKVLPAALGGASVIPGISGLGAMAGVATSMSTVLPTVIGAQGGSYAAMRAIDRLMGNRNPAKEFADRLSGTAETAPNSLPTYEAQKERAGRESQMVARDKTLSDALAATEANAVKQTEAQTVREARLKASQTEKAWKESERLKAADEARKAQQDALFDQGKITPDQARQQAEQAWARKDAEDSRGITIPELPSDLAVAKALEGFRKNNLTTMVARANTKARREEKAAKLAERQAKAESDAQYKAETALSREKTKAQKESLAEMKSRIGLMMRSKTKTNLVDAAEVKLKSAEDRAKNADTNATLSAFRLSQKIKSHTLKTQEKADKNERMLKTAEDRAKNADTNATLSAFRTSQRIKSNTQKLNAPKPEKEATRKIVSKDGGEYYHHKGHDYAIPPDVKNKAGYTQSISHKQNILINKFDAKNLKLTDHTRSVLGDYLSMFRTARNEETMRGLMDEMLSRVSAQDSKVLRGNHFDETFWKTQFGKAKR